MFFKRKKFPFYRQHDQFDCGPTCLKMIAKYNGKDFDVERLRNACSISMEGISVRGIVEGAETIGLHALPAHVDFDTLKNEAPLPCITYWRGIHFIIVYKITKKWVYVADPLHGLIKYSHDEYIKGWQNIGDNSQYTKGVIILFEATSDFYLQEEDKNNKSSLKVLRSYLKKDNRYIFQVFLGLIGGMSIQLILPFLTQSIVDKGISSQDMNFIFVILLAQITLFFSSTIFSLIQSWLLLFVGSKASILIATDYLRKLLNKPLSFFDSKTSGDILQRINDSSRIERLISTAPTTIFSYFNSIMFLFILLYYSINIFLVFIIGIVSYIVWVLFFMKKREELDYKRFDESSGTNTSIMQIVDGIQEVKVNNSELRRIWSWEEMRIKLYKTSISNLKLSQAQVIGGNMINESKNILITFLAAKGVIDGNLTLGMMLSIQYIVGQINVPLNSFVYFLADLQEAKLSLERLKDIDFKTEEEKTLNDKNLIDPENTSQDIRLENLSFRYGGSQSPLILRNINLTIPKGKVTAIVGMSGSGKTTLLKILLKLYLPTDGAVYVNNLNLNLIDTFLWRQSCGSVMQNGYIFSDTVARNITESNSLEKYSENKIFEAVRIANIDEFIEQHPSGYNALIGPVGSSGRSLSGGQYQRILLARAIYKDPKYIFLDEATSSLDANNEKVIVENLKSFYKDKTVVIVAHRLSTVKDADQIVVLNHGEIIELGNHEELVNLKGEYYNLVQNQLEISKE